MHLRAFIDSCESFGWSGGPEFKTRIRSLISGAERRNADWGIARHRYALPFQNIDRMQYAAILRMFNAARGMLHAFLYVDPNDFQAEHELFAVADGRGTYQLTKLSVVDGVSYSRPVTALYRPGPGGDAEPFAPMVTANGTPAAVTVDYDLGTVTFAVDPTGQTLRWSGEFALWVRFNQDWLPISIDNRRGADDYARNGQVELIELPAPEEAVS